ncbi:enoyl-CoA hydratase/isomerase family protein [Pseudonocardia humida]|uniref:Enoyl-CoA hydratase/isomerase family protein n=1 Tax=Pseudonocardia humida TaxID=2800819 RepID=A0ABT1A244_9PSEU|nr:enoyl-CoA hydratase-related protein [Pseudonocardia humida]MCO1657076.1 enoyl-CoA hydratase/isomerase family protein [Pseudonocardia humida]
MTRPTEHPTDQLRCELDGGIATVTLDRPDRLNALSAELMRGLVETFAALDRDPQVRVVLLAAAGARAFSAGVDLTEQATDPVVPMTGPLRNVYETVLECRKPTIALLHGWVVGGGMELAMACDLRIAAHGTRLMLPESKVGMGANFGSQMLPRLVPAGVAYQVLYLGEPMDAVDAHRFGLVNWLVPADELVATATEVATTIASRAPLTLSRYKPMVQLGASLPIAAALRMDPWPSPYHSEDRHEGAAAFRERRPPRWQGR